AEEARQREGSNAGTADRGDHLAGSFGARVFVRNGEEEAWTDADQRSRQGWYSPISHRWRGQGLITMRHSERIEKEVAGLSDLPYADLANLWMRAHGCPPPRGIKRRLLERSAAFALQTKAFGGLP